MILLKRRKARAHPTREMLTLMGAGRMELAARAWKRWSVPPVPPPHALLRLGLWLLEQGRPKEAAGPLNQFLDLYPNHLDRAAAERMLRDFSHVPGSGRTPRQSHALPR